MQGTLFRVELNEVAHLRELVESDDPGLSDVFDRYWMEETAEYTRTVTFHQSYGYEDFIEGLRPIPDTKGNIRYEWRPGAFKQLCDDAAADPDNDFILVVDEINRGNIAKIFGELITLIEDDKRLGQDNEMTVILPGSQQRFGVPDNLYLLGTMNTADRSIALLDVALRRRFTFVEAMPDPTLLDGKEVDGIPLDALLQRLNDRIEALLDRDHCLGHSYFFDVKDTDRLHFVWYRRIVPLLEEYFYNDGERLQAVLDDFVDQDQVMQGVFANPPDTFDPEMRGYRVVNLSGTQFVAALRKLAGVT
jgi:5-methylcytosine-specific restriction endonuclease McrBC GTP-binding regulatory subunit McrB